MSQETAVTVVPAEAVIRDPEAAEKALAIMTQGDLSMLKPAERADFLVNMAKGIGLNPLTRPVDLIMLNGKLTIYYNKGAADQLRAIHRVNLEIIDKSHPTPNTYAVTVRATLPNGRQDEEVGVVVLNQGMTPESQANAIMKASTKAKRRATFSILGLGLLNESEMDTIPAFKAQLDASQNAPRRLQAPPQATQTAQVGLGPILSAEVVLSAAEQRENAAAVGPWEKGEVKPTEAIAAAVAQARSQQPSLQPPAAQVMKRRLPAAPPAVKL